jgi:hypothetical protein
MGEDIILEKFGGVFAKLQGPDYFLEFHIYFSIEKAVNWVHGSWTRSTAPVHGPISWFH